MRLYTIKIKSWLLLALIGFVSCRSEDKSMPFASFGEIKTLVGDTLSFNEIIAPDFLMLKGQSMFVVSSKSDTMLWQYALPEMTLLGSGGIKGQGKDEFALFPMFCRSYSENLYIWGYTPFVIKGYSLNAEQELSLSVRYTLPEYESFNQMHLLCDSLLVYSAIPSEYAIKKINLHTGKEDGRIDIEKDDHKESFFYRNRGLVAANDKFIVYAYCYKKQIDIYHLDNMELYKRLCDTMVRPEITIGDFEHTVQYYVNLVAGKDYIYALCEGKEKKYSLEVFSFEGESIAKYEFDIVPFLFDVDEHTGDLYGYNADCDDCFLRFHLDIPSKNR